MCTWLCNNRVQLCKPIFSFKYWRGWNSTQFSTIICIWNVPYHNRIYKYIFIFESVHTDLFAPYSLRRKFHLLVLTPHTHNTYIRRGIGIFQSDALLGDNVVVVSLRHQIDNPCSSRVYKIYIHIGIYVYTEAKVFISLSSVYYIYFKVCKYNKCTSCS